MDDSVNKSPISKITKPIAVETKTDAQPSTSNCIKTSPKLKASHPSPPPTPKIDLQAPSSSKATQKCSSPKTPSMTDTSKPSSSTDNLSVLEKKKLLHAKLKNYFKVVMPMGKMAEKLEKAAPYNFFLSSITDSKPTHSEHLSITFQGKQIRLSSWQVAIKYFFFSFRFVPEILDHSLGELESSVQINFMIDIGWLLGNYYFAGYAMEPLLILYGDESPEIRDIATKRKNVVALKVQMPTPFSCSHSKVGLYGYHDGSMRVVVSTANLYEDDWQNRVQGIWMSLKLPALPSNSDTDAGESPTGFRADLLQYLITYRVTQLQPWISRIRKTDFSSVK
jgi:tyrosyl-DNA phosphodiesterase 1